MRKLQDFPLRDAWVDRTGRMTRILLDWVRHLWQVVNQSVGVVGRQSFSYTIIVGTPPPVEYSTVDPLDGVYRLSGSLTPTSAMTPGDTIYLMATVRESDGTLVADTPLAWITEAQYAAGIITTVSGFVYVDVPQGGLISVRAEKTNSFVINASDVDIIFVVEDIPTAVRLG